MEWIFLDAIIGEFISMIDQDVNLCNADLMPCCYFGDHRPSQGSPQERPSQYTFKEWFINYRLVVN